MIFLNDFSYLLPEIYLFCSLLIILIICSFLQRNINVIEASKYSYKLTILSILFSIVLTLLQPKCSALLLNYLFVYDQLGNNSKVFILFLFGLLCLTFISYYKNEYKHLENTFEHPIIMLLSLLGMFFIISSNDFLIFFLGIELQSLSLYILAASKKKLISSLEAGLKYFVIGAFSSGIILLGISLIYGSTGMTNYLDIKYLFLDIDNFEKTILYTFLVGFSFVSVGLFFKLPAAPFHSWAPDVYSGSPTFITAFFSVIPKIAILTVIVKLFYNIFYNISNFWSLYLIFCSVLSFIIGTFGAIYNLNLKRLMAYGTINHIGFILLSLSTISVEGLQGSLFYLMIYLILNLNFFAILLSLRFKNGNERVLKEVSDLSLLIFNNPILTIFLILNLFSMAGIPPLSGFFSKFYVLYSSLTSGMLAMSIFAVIISSISCFYYIRMVKTATFEVESVYKNIIVFKQIPVEISFVIILSSFFNIFFFINPNFFLDICYSISYKLFL